MDTITRLTQLDAPVAPAAPRYRERPRVSLESGAVTAQSIQLSGLLPIAAVLDLACGVARTTSVLVSVGVGRPTLLLAAEVGEAMCRAGLAPGRLELVLDGLPLRDAGVESLLALSALQDQGVQIALGGFGGAGTLDAIDHLPLSRVVLDPALLQGVPGRAGAASCLHTTLGVARRHGLQVVATGVESEMQRALLAGLGCTEGEGSLFGRAVLQRNGGEPWDADQSMYKH